MAIEYGISHLYYAAKTADGYESPINIPGVADIDLKPTVWADTFTGLDGITRTENEHMGGYDGTITLYNLPTSFLCKFWGYVIEDNGLITEKETTSGQKCAILYESSGPESKRYVYYNCLLRRPEINLETIGKQTTINKIKIETTARANDSGSIRSMCLKDNALYNTWFTGAAL